MVEDNWRANQAQLARAPEGCIFIHPFSKNAHDMSSSVNCSGGGMSLTITTQMSWPDSGKISMSMRSVVTFEGIAGESVATVKVTSHFISSKCGSIAPGASVPVK
jgi:hypothetical protein